MSLSVPFTSVYLKLSFFGLTVTTGTFKKMCSVQPCFPAVTRKVPKILVILHYTVNDITCAYTV